MPSLIDKALQSRRTTFQVAIVAALIALGVNLISSWLSDYFKNFSALVLLTGVLFAAIGFLYFTQRLLQDRHHFLEIDGVLFLDPKQKQPVGVDEYQFSEVLVRTLRAAFVENEALRVAWEQEMFSPRSNKGPPLAEGANDQTKQKQDVEYFSIVKMTVDDGDVSSSSRRVLFEAIEFCFLDFLSLHLSEYFDHRTHDSTKVCVLEREAIPHVVLANRILALLTTPIEDRKIFIQSGMNKNPPECGEIHAIYGSNGAVYERFHLTLPLNTVISRPEPGVLTLEHPRFEMSLRVGYHGFAENLPRYFSDLYVSDTIEDVDARKVQISVSATLRPFAFFHVSGWEYYEWIDSFFAYLDDRASFRNFLHRIDWDSVATGIRAELIRKRRVKRNEPNKPPKLTVVSGPAAPDQ